MKTDLWSNEVVPIRTVEWEDGRDGAAVLLIPRFRKGLLAKYVQPRLKKKPNIKVSLDELGSFVWRNMDGTKNFGVIVDSIKQRYTDKVDQAEERLQKFLFILQRNEFAKLVVPSDRS